MTRPVVVAVDAAGGDFGPEPLVEGALRAARRDVSVLLAGPPGTLPDAGSLPANVAVVPSGPAIPMDADPVAAVRAHRDASVLVAAGCVSAGEADAFVSAGSTGAGVAAARLRLRRLPGVSRPALAAALPSFDGRRRLLLDAGANADCRPEWLPGFARLGRAYATARWGLAEPVVGLLNIGTEDAKGNALAREAHGLLEPESWFAGNVEGYHLFRGPADVVVTDGFTGNVALKVLAGGARALAGEGGAVPEGEGGSLLLGVRGVCVLAHGASRPDEFCRAILAAAASVSSGTVEALAGSAEEVVRAGVRP